MLVRLSTSPLTYPNPGPEVPGMLDLTWLRPGPGIPVPDGDVTRLMAEFLQAVTALATPDWTIGTAYTIAVHEALPAGGWHIDAGGAQRFTAAVVPDGGPPEIGHQFAGEVWPMPSNYVAAYGTEEHRRPSVPAGWRIFCSASLYGPEQEPDLSCPRLAPLRQP